MTSDIAQRLRAIAGERYSEGANSAGTAGLLEDAATEIDRLRTELEKRRKATSTDCGLVESMAGGRRS